MNGIDAQESTSGKRKQDRLEHVLRLFNILYRLQFRAPEEPLTLQTLATYCGRSVSTVKRDLTLLRTRFDIGHDRKQHTYFLSAQAIPSLGYALTEVDVRTLALIRTLLTLPGIPQKERIQSVLDKILGGLSADQQQQLLTTQVGLLSDSLPRDYTGTPLSMLLTAIQKHRTIRMDYTSFSSGAREWRSMDPYAVEPRDGVFWELHGWCHRNREFRTFALDRIFAVQLQPSVYRERTEEWRIFCTQQSVGGMRGDLGTAIAVDVRFTVPVAASAMHMSWPDSLTLAEQSDGSVLMTGTVPGGQALSRMVSLLLAFRRHAVVNGGVELRTAMTDEITAIMDSYKSL